MTFYHENSFLLYCTLYTAYEQVNNSLELLFSLHVHYYFSVCISDVLLSVYVHVSEKYYLVLVHFVILFSLICLDHSLCQKSGNCVYY